MQTDFKKPIIIFAIMLAATMVLGIARKSIEHDNQEERLKNKLGVLGATYYQKVYLPTVNNVDELGSYTEGGMKVGLSELISAIYYEDPKEFVNNQTKKQCNYNETYVIIYPQNPYTEDDYEMKVNLECGF